MRRYVILAAILSLLLLCGCEKVEAFTNEVYPYFEYRNSSFNFDPLNRRVNVLNGYVLDEGHSYDISETDDGYDITFHLRRNDQ